MKADTGATGNYIRTEDSKILTNLKSTTKGSRVRLPDDTIIAATDEGNLPIPDLPSVATHAHTFPARQLCDSDCSALFTKDSLKVYNHRNNLAVLMGRRNYNNGLWDVNISSSQSSAPQTSPPSLSTASLNAVLRYDKTKTELATYIHNSCRLSHQIIFHDSHPQWQLSYMAWPHH